MVKNPPVNAEDIKDAGLIPGLGRYPGEGNDNPLQYSCLGTSMDRGVLWATVHGLTVFKVKFVLQSNTGGVDPLFVDVICHLNMRICFK